MQKLSVRTLRKAWGKAGADRSPRVPEGHWGIGGGEGTNEHTTHTAPPTLLPHLFLPPSLDPELAL